MKKINIQCPICSKTNTIEVSEKLIKNVPSGLLVVNIAQNLVCEHSFIAYLDKNLAVRDYFTADFQIEIPETVPVEAFENMKIPERERVNIDLIKLNIQPLLLTHVLKAIFSKKKAVIIFDDAFLGEHFLNFLKEITEGTFKFNVSIIAKEDYKRNKKKYKDSMVFEKLEIYRNLDKIIDPKKMKVEKQIVINFLTESETIYSYIKLRNEINKAYSLSKSIAEYAENFDEIGKEKHVDVHDNSIIANILDNVVNKDKFIANIISDFLKDVHGIKVGKQYLNFLMNIVRYYFELDFQNKIRFTSF